MAHLIVKGIDLTYSINGDTAWHNLANTPRNSDGSFVSTLLREHLTDIFYPIIPLDDMASDGPAFTGEIDHGTLTAIRAMVNAGDIEMAFLACRAALRPNRIEFDGWKGVAADMRASGGRIIPLAVHGEGYREIENAAFWDAKERALQGIDHIVTTAGTLDGGKRFYLCIELPDSKFQAGGESFREYLCLVTSHDGTMAAQAFISRIRIVCNNTFTAAEAGTKCRFKLKHTKGVDASMPGLEQFIKAAHEGRLQFQSSYEQARNTTMTPDTAMAALTGYFWKKTAGKKNDTTGKAGNDRLSTRTRNQIDEIFQAFQGGIGNAGQTFADLLNGVTQHYTSGSGTGLTKGGQEMTALERHSSSEWGNAADIKSEFARIILGADGKEMEELVTIGETKGIPAYLEGTGTSRPVFMSGLDRTRAKAAPVAPKVIDFNAPPAASTVAPASDFAALLDMPL